MPAQPEKIVPVILSGGSGTRLWPMSREDLPKQFHSLINPKESLMMETLKRVADPQRFHAPVILGNQAHRYLIAEQLHKSGIKGAVIITEPCVRNTAPALTAAAMHLRKHHKNATMLVLPTDQYIADTETFLAGVDQAAEVARKGHLVTFGIKPEYAETGYGYIRRGAPLDSNRAFAVDAFVEKPDAATAESYIAGGDYFWNSGMFMFPSLLLLEEIERHNPEIGRLCHEAVSRSTGENGFVHLHEPHFKQTPDISIDYALMEKTKKAAIVPLDCGWSDTGAWEALWRLSPKDNQNNVAVGECQLVDSRNCYVRSEKGPVVATYGVDNLVIVATRDAVLVAGKEHAHSLKTLVEQLRKNRPRLVAQNCQAYRPWGMFESLDTGQRHQVKRIRVKPGEKLSLQMHYHRAEHWIVVSGTAKATCDDREVILTENQSIYIPYGSTHRIENPGKIDLEIIEVQSGAYLGEDDIVRFDDQYGRVGAAA